MSEEGWKTHSRRSSIRQPMHPTSTSSTCSHYHSLFMVHIRASLPFLQPYFGLGMLKPSLSHSLPEPLSHVAMSHHRDPY
mmetsp:Transcript_7451/g.19875  ORF Transcript_7451/g.19875 Transcript_7451/m.19875 type:complete len:80 (-) Transcript_7451:58-297(-)|eukprot:scaffold79181_cov16-Tisochrysis_lutea.AAC.1